MCDLRRANFVRGVKKNPQLYWYLFFHGWIALLRSEHRVAAEINCESRRKLGRRNFFFQRETEKGTPAWRVYMRGHTHHLYIRVYIHIYFTVAVAARERQWTCQLRRGEVGKHLHRRLLTSGTKKIRCD